jgi:serine/threonine-protein kinase
MSRFCPLCGAALMTIETPVPPSRRPGRFGTGDLLPLLTLADRYVIMEKIAQGGMGAVYKARDQRLQSKVVAVKEMSEAAIAPAERACVLEAFQREAKLLAKLQHPHLVRVSDLFQDAERHYMVMEFIEGKTLEEMLDGCTEPFPEDQVLVWAGQLCDVLTFLHGQTPKIIYRDMKPANVMVLDGSDDVKLIDFGIARLYKPGKKGDTPDGYAPPEQYGKAQTDERADVYALGVMLHQLLTLHDPVTVPFQFPRVRGLNSKVSRRVDAAIAQALQSRRDKRHQSIAELQDALIGKGAAKRSRPPAQKKQPPARPTMPAATPPPASGELVYAPFPLDFGMVWVGGDAPEQSGTLTFPAGEEATLSTDVPWLHVYPRSVKQRGSKVTVTLDTTRLRSGKLQLGGNWFRRWAGWHTRRLVLVEQNTRAHVEIKLKGGEQQRVPANVIVVPRPWLVKLGWMMTGGAMLLEASVVGGTLLALAAAILGVF